MPATRNVLITTEYKGVFVGQIAADQDLSARSMPLFHARMAIYFGTSRGVLELCETGPTPKSKVSAVADIPMLHGITAVFAVTDAAWSAWQKR